MYRKHPLNPEFGRSRRMGFHLTGGCFLPLVGGGHLLYRSEADATEIDYDLPVGVSGPAAVSVTEFTFMPHAASTYRYGLRATACCGCEEQNTDVVASVTFGADGAMAKLRPNSPWGLQATPASATATKLSWRYDATGEAASPAKFNIYSDGVLVGSTSFARTIASYSATASHASASGHVFRIRAVTAESMEDENTIDVAVCYDLVAPPTPRMVIVEKTESNA